MIRKRVILVLAVLGCCVGAGTLITTYITKNADRDLALNLNILGTKSSTVNNPQNVMIGEARFSIPKNRFFGPIQDEGRASQYIKTSAVLLEGLVPDFAERNDLNIKKFGSVDCCVRVLISANGKASDQGIWKFLINRARRSAQTISTNNEGSEQHSVVAPSVFGTFGSSTSDFYYQQGEQSFSICDRMDPARSVQRPSCTVWGVANRISYKITMPRMESGSRLMIHEIVMRDLKSWMK